MFFYLCLILLILFDYSLQDYDICSDYMFIFLFLFLVSLFVSHLVYFMVASLLWLCLWLCLSLSLSLSFCLCVKDRLPDMQTCLNLYPCIMKLSLSVGYSLIFLF